MSTRGGQGVRVVDEVAGRDRVLERAGAAEPASAEVTMDDVPATPRRILRLRKIARLAVAAVALLGTAGTIGFGSAWSGLHDQQVGEAQVRTAASSFLLALTNFDAKSVDADFARIESDATGSFAGQARRFFGSSIRQQLETALASSRGQVRSLYVESYGGRTASVYGVVDQTYVNAKMSAPAADVLRIVLGLASTGKGWKISEVTVLEGPSPTSPGPTSPSSTSPSSTSPSGG